MPGHPGDFGLRKDAKTFILSTTKMMRKQNGCQGIHEGGFFVNYRELAVNFNSGGSNLSTRVLVHLSTVLITKKVENTKALRKLGGYKHP